MIKDKDNHLNKNFNQNMNFFIISKQELDVVRKVLKHANDLNFFGSFK